MAKPSSLRLHKGTSITSNLLQNQNNTFKRTTHPILQHQRLASFSSTSSKMTTYNITITSDIVCPWCYIGHTRLSRAISNHKKLNPEDKFNLKYLPFYLNPPPKFTPSSPAFPIESKPRQEYYAAKFGSERATQIFGMLNQVASSEGLNFKSGGMTGQSRNGHRLVHYAQNHGGEQAQNDAMLGLWRRYFEQEVDITKLDVLVETGVEAGLGSRQEIEEYLVSGKDGEEVDQLADEARDKDINGVPHYVIQDLWGISGAQEPQAFEALFQRYKDMEAKGSVGHGNTASDKGEAC